MFNVTYHNSGYASTATKNRLMYRGYYFDVDVGMYYLNSRYYNQNTCRFISPDSVMSGVNGSLHGFNLYAYCFNNPVNMTDASGNWPEWIEKFGAWFKENVGVATVLSETYEAMSAKTLFGGYEYGESASSVIAGDISKPISVYSTVSPSSESVLDNKIGTQVNINGGGVAIESNGISNSIIVAGKNSSVELIIGLDKVGYTYKSGVTFDQHTAEMYYHAYIRTLPTAGLIASIVAVSKGILIPIPIPA